VRIRGLIEFDEAEREVLVRALRGHGLALKEMVGERKKEVRYPVQVHLNRISEHKELYDYRSLMDLNDTLLKLIGTWGLETDPAWWREQGAPGSDEAIEGLARERSLAVERAVEASGIVNEAMWMVAEPVETGTR
jgi:hypothetical protein